MITRARCMRKITCDVYLSTDVDLEDLPEVKELLVSLSTNLHVWESSRAGLVILPSPAQKSRRLVTFDQLPRVPQNNLVVVRIDFVLPPGSEQSVCSAFTSGLVRVCGASYQFIAIHDPNSSFVLAPPRVPCLLSLA